MTDDDKTGFAAIDAKASEHVDDAPSVTKPTEPENLQTTSAHSTEQAQATTVSQVKADHDAAIDAVKSDLATLRSEFEAEILKLTNKFADLTDTAEHVSASTDPDEGKFSLAIHHRFEQIERAVGIRHEATS